MSNDPTRTHDRRLRGLLMLGVALWAAVWLWTAWKRLGTWYWYATAASPFASPDDVELIRQQTDYTTPAVIAVVPVVVLALIGIVGALSERQARRRSQSRAMVGLLALLLCIGCAPLTPTVSPTDDWDAGLRRLNDFVARAGFRPSGISAFEPIARCRARLVTRWHPDTAAAKNYTDVSNVAELDFGRDIERVEFVPAHTLERDGRTEVWRNRIAIVVRPGFEDEFHFRRPGDTEERVTRGETDDVTVGVIDEPDRAEVDAFIATATELVEHCRATMR